MSLNLRYSKNVSPEIMELDAQLAKAVEASDPALLQEVTREVARLREASPKDPSVLSLSGLVSLFRGNIPAARVSLAQATKLDAQGHNQKELLGLILRESRSSLSVDDFLHQTDEDLSALLNEKKLEFQNLFGAGKWVEADETLQFVQALENPFSAAMPPLLLMRAATEDEMQQVDQNFLMQMAAIEKEITPEYLSQAASSLTRQQEELVTRSLELLSEGDSVVVDFRAMLGNLLGEVQSRASSASKTCQIFAVEPLQAFVEHAKKVKPLLPTISGKVSGELCASAQLPERIDLSLFPSILSFTTEKEVEKIFSALAQRSRWILISDQLLNSKAESSRIRGSRIYHCYDRLLREAGFECHSYQLHSHLNEFATGVIVAKNQSIASN